MSISLIHGAFSGLFLCVLGALCLSVKGDKHGDKVFESSPGMIHELRAVLADMAGEGRAYLGRLAGEQTVLSAKKAFSQVVGVVSSSVAGGLTVLLQYARHFMQAAGLKADFPVDRVSPEGVVFVVQWLLLALIGYWLLSLTLRLVASTLRRALWMVKVGAALACFVLILSDHSVGTEKIAVRLAVLVVACILLGVGSGRGSDPANQTARLEEQVKILERRLREMERWRKTEE